MYIFVYGTLRQGFGNHRLLDDAEYIGVAKTTPTFTMISLGAFPGLLRGGNTSVEGEIYKVTEPIRNRLDRLEGHPTWYRRELIELVDGPFEWPVEAYIYLSPPANAKVIESGSWVTK